MKEAITCEIKIYVQIPTGVKKTVYLKGVSEKFAAEVMDQVFGTKKPQRIEKEQMVQQDSIPVIVSAPKSKQVKVEKAEAVSVSRPKQLPKIDSDRSLSVPIGDALKGALTVKSDTEPDFYKSGIKERDGVKLYRTRYYCQKSDCNGKGNHYLPEGTKTTYCRECEAQLEVRPAHEDGFPFKDEWGNFYLADRLTEDEDFS